MHIESLRPALPACDIDELRVSQRGV
jgi:hypothetical protein